LIRCDKYIIMGPNEGGEEGTELRCQVPGFLDEVMPELNMNTLPRCISTKFLSVGHFIIWIKEKFLLIFW
jgi:hypothetical protein